MKNKYCILLTGTINPSNVFSLERTDPKIRENDYYQAILLWIKTNIPIVFCENSNWNAKRITQLKTQYPHFEFIQYTEDSDLSTKGKGLGEFKIMQHAFTHSKIIENADYIIKVTGRLYVKNFKYILNKIDTKKFDIVAPLENYLQWSDSRFLIFNKSFFDTYFVNFGSKINDSKGYCFEKAFANSIHAALADNKQWITLPCFPNYKGISGTFNKKYSFWNYESIIKRIRFQMLHYFIKPSWEPKIK